MGGGSCPCTLSHSALIAVGFIASISATHAISPASGLAFQMIAGHLTALPLIGRVTLLARAG